LVTVTFARCRLWHDLLQHGIARAVSGAQAKRDENQHAGEPEHDRDAEDDHRADHGCCAV
jgi:hypothetical protein